MPRCLLTRNFTEKPVRRASGYKGPWIFVKIPSNGLMVATMTRNFTGKPVSRGSGYKGDNHKGSWIFAKIPSNTPVFSDSQFHGKTR